MHITITQAADHKAKQSKIVKKNGWRPRPLYPRRCNA